MSDDRSDRWRWHEYPVGVAGEVSRACVRALFAFLVGIGCAFVLILCAGILAEEHLLGDPGLENAVDDLSRMSMGVLMGFGMVAWLLFAVAGLLREWTTSRALVGAAAREASRYDVPSPEQVASVTAEPARQLTWFGWANAALAGLFGVVGLGIAVFGGDDEALSYSLIALGYALVMGVVGLAGPKWLTPAHERRRDLIAAHWSSEDEGQAWKRARRSHGREKHSTGFGLAERFMYGAGVLAVLGMVVMTASVGMRCAAVPGRTSQDCDRTTYSSPVEAVLAWGFWIFAVLLPLAAVLMAIGLVLDWHRRRAGLAGLGKLLADPRSSRPDDRLLAYYARRRLHPLCLIGAAVSGIGMVFAAGSYLVGRGRGLGSEDVFAVYLTESAIALWVSGGLFAAALVGGGVANMRGRGLRNDLMERWPTPPSWSAGEDGRVLRAKRGPALHGSRYVKVGKNARSH